MQLKQIIANALSHTSSLWQPIAVAFHWVHQVATLLDNEAQHDGKTVCSSFEQLLGQMEQHKAQAGALVAGIEHFLKVTRSYAPGLFHCYDIDGLPRTNNGLEQLFGRWRHHQRRCTGRKVAPASLVVRGAVQIVAAMASQLHSFTAFDLATVSIEAWRSVHADLEHHQHKRTQQRHFRQSPAAYLDALEQKFLQLALPP